MYIYKIFSTVLFNCKAETTEKNNKELERQKPVLTESSSLSQIPAEILMHLDNITYKKY